LLKSIKVFSTAGIILILLVLVSLACNLPVDMLRLYADVDNPEDDAEDIHEVVAEYDATLVSSEGEVTGLPFEGWTKWVCKDIDGEINFYKKNAELAPETYIINKADLDLTLEIKKSTSRVDLNFLRIDYLLNMEVDEGWLNLEGDAIEHWNNAKWSGTGWAEISPPTVDDRSISGVFDVTTNMQGTYPSTLSQEYVSKHNFFILFPPENYNIAYFCDVGANPVPDGWEKLTGENFRDFCPYYYYECAFTKP